MPTIAAARTPSTSLAAAVSEEATICGLWLICPSARIGEEVYYDNDPCGIVIIGNDTTKAAPRNSPKDVQTLLAGLRGRFPIA